MRLSEFAQRCGGQLVGADAEYGGFALDSGQVEPGNLFLAIRGARVDGHDFVPSAMQSGAVAALVERPVEGNHVLVPNLVDALANFGRSIRAEFAGPVVGVTGSAGKTTTKEFLAAALSPLDGVLKTEGNRNTEFTSPLVWADLTSQSAAVIEMSMRGFGQVEHLARISRPTIGIVTNIGYAHVELVGSRAGIAQAKGEMFQNLSGEKVAIYWAEDEFAQNLRTIQGPSRWITFGYSDDADCRILDYRAVDWSRSVVTGSIDGCEWVAEMPVVGRHIALNAAAAVAAATACGVNPSDAAAQIVSSTLPPMRMEWHERDGVRILLDTYNASPPATIAALETLRDLPASGRRLAVLGEMREMGSYSEEGHRAVGRAVAKTEMDHVVLYGPSAHFVLEEAVRSGYAPNRATIVESLDGVRDFLRAARAGDIVLVKGSRALQLEDALK